MDRTVFLNGDFVPESAAKLSIFDRGLLFADSVYEGFGILDSQLVDFEYHMDRLDRSLGELGDAAHAEMLGNMFDGGCLTSALSGAGIEALLQAIDARLGAGRRLSSVTIGLADGAARAWLFDRGEVRLTEMADSGSETINVAMDEADWSRFCARWPDLVHG